MRKIDAQILLSLLTFLNLALFIVYVYLMDPIWTIISNYLVDAIGRNYNWFLAILAASWVLLVLFGIHIARISLHKISPSLFSYLNKSGLQPNLNLPLGIFQPTGTNQQLWKYIRP